VIVMAGCLHGCRHRNETRITVLPLDGGDSIFVDAPGYANDLLVDCGNEPAADYLVVPFLQAQGVNRLPGLVLTHGDVRHVGGADLIEKEFGVRRVVTSSVPFRSAPYRGIVEALGRQPLRWRQINRGDTIGGWNVLHPKSDDRCRQADDGVLVLRGEFCGVRVLLCSDLSRLGQSTLLGRENDLRADLVVCGIPTRGQPVEDAFIDAVRPRLIIVSASEVPSSERATQELRLRLARRGIPVFYTSDDRAVSVRLDESGWEVRAMDGRVVRSGS
jgi:competence protein ComEC